MADCMTTDQGTGPSATATDTENPTIEDMEYGWTRGHLTPHKLRRAGVPSTLMSDFEFMGALFRDSQYDGHEGQPEVMGGYDRRGLLNVVSFLVNRINETESGR